MMDFLNELSHRNPVMYWFGWISLAGALFSFVMIMISDTQVLGINAWIKPAKFYLSTWIFIWTIAWYMKYLPEQNVVSVYSWFTIAVFVFELIYITWQASIGQKSHFNVSTSFHSAMWGLMGGTIALMTLFTAFIGFLFFKNTFPELPNAYVWAIRFGIILFVIFAFEGGVMGSQLSHTVGAADGGKGLPFLNWSVSDGDLRIAHFVGMHALQVLPLLAFFVIKDTKIITAASLLYFALAVFVLVQALQGRPFLKI
jgi:hypothetical protein